MKSGRPHSIQDVAKAKGVSLAINDNEPLFFGF